MCIRDRTYVSACLSAGGDLELRFCISQRRRSYGLTFLHTGASRARWTRPMWLWLEFGAHGGVCGGMGGRLPISAGFEPQQHFAQNSYKTQGERSVPETADRGPGRDARARIVDIRLQINDYLTRQAGALRLPRRIQRASPIPPRQRGAAQERSGRRRFGVTFLHMRAPAAIWSYVSAYLSADGDSELRLCISQRRRSYGLTFLHAGASRARWTRPMWLWFVFRAH